MAVHETFPLSVTWQCQEWHHSWLL